VLIATGRQPNTKDIGLENTKVKVNEKGFVVVDEQQRTSDPKIFAVGIWQANPCWPTRRFEKGRWLLRS
jgi:dihydrolipoamide dehydrogenase